MNNTKSLSHYDIEALPIVQNILKRLKLKEILAMHLPTHKAELVPVIDTLILLLCNLTFGKLPLYKLGNWVRRLDLRCLCYEDPVGINMTDDRFGKALDKLYNVDRASLQTSIVLSAIKEFNINLDRIHNDSTSVKACGKIEGKTNSGIELKHGHSKDHRPDLKQLIFNLSICADGGVPIHHKVYSGNRSDDTTHIETWNTLVSMCRRKDFMYVGDSKLCTDKQLNHICSNSGRAITIMPRTWSEHQLFTEKLKTKKVAKAEIWRRIKPGTTDDKEYFSVFRGNYYTEKRGYKIHWIYSSEKKERDRKSRNSQLQKTEQLLANIVGKLNTKAYSSAEAISAKCNKALDKYDTHEYFELEIGTSKEIDKKQVGKGRPGANTTYVDVICKVYTLSWLRNAKAIKEAMSLDGVFPLLCTDKSVTSTEVIKAYKYQPKIEKRFSQFKNTHNAAPLLFNTIRRVEANMFVFFLALMVQSLIERELKLAMDRNNITSIDVYPEDRYCKSPTAQVIFERFARVTVSEIKNGRGEVLEVYREKLDNTQKLILSLLGIEESTYWNE